MESEYNLDFNIFRSCNRISCRISPPHPINIKGHDRLENPIDQINTTIIFLLSFCPSFFPSTICCSSFVSTSIEGVLGGLPTLEQPCVRLPRRILPGRRSLVSPPACPATTGLSIGAASCRRSLRFQTFSCVGPSSASTRQHQVDDMNHCWFDNWAKCLFIIHTLCFYEKPWTVQLALSQAIGPSEWNLCLKIHLLVTILAPVPGDEEQYVCCCRSKLETRRPLQHTS